MSEKLEQGYGSAEWQKPEVTAEKALDQVSKFSPEDIKEIKSAVLKDMEPGQAREGAIMKHVRQVDAIGMKLAYDSGAAVTEDEKKLAELCFLFHDVSKKGGQYWNLFSHAYESAEEIAQDKGQVREYGPDKKPLSELVPPEIGQKLRESRDLSNFIAQVVESHSAIPFIEDIYSYDDLDKVQSIYGAESLPFLVEKTNDKGETYWGLPEPVEKYAKLLRAADTLSNYGLITNLEIETPEGYDPQFMKYAGFIKIVNLNKGDSFSERIFTLEESAKKAIDAGIYDEFPTARREAELSLLRAAYMQVYFETTTDTFEINGETVNANDLYKVQKKYQEDISTSQIMWAANGVESFKEEYERYDAILTQVADAMAESMTKALTAMEEANLTSDLL